MKLRDRLFLFSTVQLMVFGAVFAIAFMAFNSSVIPMFEGLMREKSGRIARLLAGDLDVGLAAEDPKLMESTLDRTEREADVAYVAVRDAHGVIVAARGVAPDEVIFAGAPRTAVIGEDGIWSWEPISLEGVSLGSVAVVLSTARLSSLEEGVKWLAAGLTLLWLIALGYSVVFARSLVSPIRAMMDFARKVAGGVMSDRLRIDPPGELCDLRDDLNDMTADLEGREYARLVTARRTEEMQSELLAATRTAGMAEIATGVLHNVGNVLNNLNVSVSMIGEQARSSRIPALSKSIALFEDYPGGLPAFLSTDRGKILPGYLCSVSKKLVAEHDVMMSELASMARNVDHIKSIVAMQQAYARPSGVTERLALGELIDDAVGLSEASLVKHGIEVVRHYEDGATVVTDRHKLLQILINLVSNARHALTGRSLALLRLTVSVRTTDAGIAIAVADTGCGIPAENLDKIFQHGFTTKQDGHGFGLHASANAARELHGTLVVASDGENSGATFTLTIPTEPRANDAHQN